METVFHITITTNLLDKEKEEKFLKEKKKCQSRVATWGVTMTALCPWLRRMGSIFKFCFCPGIGNMASGTLLPPLLQSACVTIVTSLTDPVETVTILPEGY